MPSSWLAANLEMQTLLSVPQHLLELPLLCVTMHKRRSGTWARPLLKVPHLVMWGARLCRAPASLGQAMLPLGARGSGRAQSAHPQAEGEPCLLPLLPMDPQIQKNTGQ